MSANISPRSIAAIFIFSTLCLLSLSSGNLIHKDAKADDEYSHYRHLRGPENVQNATVNLSGRSLTATDGRKNSFFIVIMESPRVGSTFLSYELRTCSKIHMGDEVLGAWRISRRGKHEPFIRKWFEDIPVRNADKDFHGFRVIWADVQDALRFLKHLDPKVIFLRRRNRVKKAISLIRAIQLNTFHVIHDVKNADDSNTNTTEVSDSVKCGNKRHTCYLGDMFEANVEMFKTAMDYLEWFDDHAETFVRSNWGDLMEGSNDSGEKKYMEVFYEDMNEHPDIVLNRIFAFLGVDANDCYMKSEADVPQIVEKNTPNSLENAVRNFAALQHVVANVPEYTQMLQGNDEIEYRKSRPEANALYHMEAFKSVVRRKRTTERRRSVVKTAGRFDAAGKVPKPPPQTVPQSQQRPRANP